MRYSFDENYFLDTLGTLLATPSPVGYYPQLNPVLVRMAEELGYTVTFDNRSTPYITLEGEDNSRTVMLSAHADTLGFVVRGIDADGKLRIRQLGGVNYQNLESESVTVHTRDGRIYTGMLICRSHSVHVFDDAKTLERNENSVVVLLDEPVSSKEEVTALGICNGDIISIDPRCEITPNGYIKSRFLDDKASVACFFAMLKYLREHGLRPKYRTLISFPYCEEIGLGGTYVPEEVSEFVAVDIGLIGPDHDGDEHKVSICVKDAGSHYDYGLTTRLTECARLADCAYALDVFYHYGSDAGAAMRAGNNLRAALFGVPVYCSHGRERTHMDAIRNTINLLLAYVLDI